MSPFHGNLSKLLTCFAVGEWLVYLNSVNYENHKRLGLVFVFFQRHRCLVLWRIPQTYVSKSFLLVFLILLQLKSFVTSFQQNIFVWTSSSSNLHSMECQSNVELDYNDFYEPEIMAKTKTSTDDIDCIEKVISCSLPILLPKQNMYWESLVILVEAASRSWEKLIWVRKTEMPNACGIHQRSDFSPDTFGVFFCSVTTWRHLFAWIELLHSCCPCLSVGARNSCTKIFIAFVYFLGGQWSEHLSRYRER